MIKAILLTSGLLAASAAPTPKDLSSAVERIEELEIMLAAKDARISDLESQLFKLDNETMVESHSNHRELFPLYSVGTKCARRGCSIYHQINAVNPMMSLGDERKTKGPVKALEMLALNDDLNTVIQSGDMCTRRRAMTRAAGLAAGLALSAVNAPAFAAETKTVKMGSDSGQLVFVPDEIKICAGDTVTWVNNKGGPHNVVFDEEDIPDGVSQEAISMDDQLGDEGATYSKKFDVKGSYGYYCEPHRGAGMAAQMVVS
jgi:plastocyanin